MSCCGRGAGQPRNPDSGAQSRGFVSKRLVAPVTGRAAIRSTAFEYAGVNAIGNDQDRSVVPFGDKVPHQSPDRPGQAHALPLLAHKGEFPVDPPNSVGITTGDQATSLLDRHVIDAVACGVGQIDDPGERNRLVHESALGSGG